MGKLYVKPQGIGFVLEKQVDSCLVTKELLIQLEEYLFRQIPVVMIPADNAMDHYTLAIADSLGTEILSSISGLLTSQLPDSTNEVSINLDTYIPYKSEKRLRILINFNKIRHFSKLSIKYEGESGRETISGIYDRITKIIEPQRTPMNGILHYRKTGVVIALLLGLLLGVALMSAVIPMGVLIKAKLVSLSSFAALGILGLYLAGRRFLPYTSFDSRSYQAKQGAFRWLFLLLLGSAILGALGFVLNALAMIWPMFRGGHGV
jgi:hypothetical protein